MTAPDISSKIKNDILYRIRTLNSLVSVQEQTHAYYANEYLNFGVARDKDNETLNQALNDAVLQAMASLIDYYFIYCMSKLGVKANKITVVQYNSLNKNTLLGNSNLTDEEKKIFPLSILRAKFEEKILKSCNLQIDEIDCHDYWMCYLSDSIAALLQKYGIPGKKMVDFQFDVDKGKFKISDEIIKYHSFMSFLYMNPANPSGVRYGIYMELNNFLKHNAIPYLTLSVENFEKYSENRLYSFFAIESDKYIFLKGEILKNIALANFENLKSDLQKKLIDGGKYLSELERRWELGSIISVHKEDGICNKSGDTLYLDVDGVFIAKTADSILIDARSSFRSVISKLITQVELRMGYFDNPAQ